MAKLSNILKFVAIGAAAGAGTYYYLKKKDEPITVGDEAEDTVSDTTKDVMDFFTEKKDQIVNSREYIQLNKSAKEATSAIAKTVMDAAAIIKEKAMEAKDGVGVVADEEKDAAVDYAFEEFESENTEDTEESENVNEDGETVEDEIADEVERDIEE